MQTFGESLTRSGKTWSDVSKLIDALILAGATGNKSKQVEISEQWRMICNPTEKTPCQN